LRPQTLAAVADSLSQLPPTNTAGSWSDGAQLETAVEMGVFALRAFVRSCQVLAGSRDFRRQNKGIASREFTALRSQFATSKTSRGERHSPPCRRPTSCDCDTGFHRLAGPWLQCQAGLPRTRIFLQQLPSVRAARDDNVRARPAHSPYPRATC